MKEQVRSLWIKGFVTAAVFAMASPQLAFADGNDLSTAANNSVSQFNGIINVISYVAYAMGTFFTVAGIYKLKQHAENAGSNPLAHGIGRLATGAALLALPNIMGMVFDTSNAISGEGSAGFIPLSGIGAGS